MNVKDLQTAIPLLFNSGLTPFIWGFHGTGKSQVIRQIASNLGGWKCFDFRLNTQADVGDILGLQDFSKDENGNITSSTHYKPQWLEDCIDFCNENPDKGAIVFFDELNRAARHDMVGPIFQMSIDKRLHIWDFPTNLHIVVASNPNTEDYNVLNLDDKALLDRFCHIKFTPTRQEFINFARDKEVNSSIVNFLLEQPKMIEATDKLEDFSVDSFATPSRRTWIDGVNRLMEQDPSRQIFQELLKGLVGTAASTAFITALDKEEKPLEVEEVLKKYKRNKKVDGVMNRVDTEFSERVESFKNSPTGVRVDMLNVTNQNLIEFLKKEENKITPKQGKNLVDYALDLPGDLMIPLLREVYVLEGSNEVLNKSDYREQELIAAIRTAKAKDVKEEETSSES